MKSHNNQTNEVNMGLQPTKSESFDINADGLVMYLYSAGDNGNRYTRVEFNDYSTYNDYIMIMDRETLKGMADFINNYLEKK
jgi:hypothetical protein